MPVRRADASPRRCAWAPRSSTRSSGRCTSAGLATAVGDEGGFAPDLDSNEEALEALIAGIEAAGYKPGERRRDRARPGDERVLRRTARYVLEHEGRTLSAAELVDYWADLVGALPDRLDRGRHGEEDWDGWKALTERLGERVQLVGDDLFVTNTERLRRGIEAGVANSILIKVNQIGTLTETLEAIADGARRRLHRGDVAPLGRDRGRRRSPTSPSRPAAARSRPARRRAPIAWPSTTSCCASRRRSAPTRRSRAERASGAERRQQVAGAERRAAEAGRKAAARRRMRAARRSPPRRRRAVARRGPTRGVRWDRVGRVGRCWSSLVVIVLLYVGAGARRLLSTRHERRRAARRRAASLQARARARC